ncbi:hypothetical protein HGA13_11290 [Nocardia speluncae]|uniref:Uncharacterized protein n=1 Tax=Nocardia speluncae TaxID=419477 RepID=A0A846XG53_9NOCA|nr:hypothetical protein [Nocardia speluncae]NKY33656.1 hypothetical protein [Nocardia speluncae]
MSEDRPHPLEGLLTEVLEGRLSVNMGAGSSEAIRVNAEEFVYMERDCEGFKLLIRSLQRTADEIWKREQWDIGENSKGLSSADVLVSRFRTKAKNSDDGNDVHAILEQHFQIVEDIQELHRAIAQRYMETDGEFAARYNELMAGAPPSVPLQMPPAFPTSPDLG